MKLLVVSSWFPHPPDNGSKLRAYHLLASLAKRHTVTLLSFAERGEESEALKALCETVHTVPGNPFKPGRPLAFRGFLSAMPRSYAETYSERMQTLVDEAAGRHDAAVGFELGAALYLARHPALPCVFEEAEVGAMRDQYRAQPTGLQHARQGLTWWKFARFMRGLTGQFARTTVVSDLERQHFADIGCDLTRVRVVPNGVDRASLMMPNRPAPGRLIYPGAITYSANLDAVRYFLGEIFPRIQAVRPDVTFHITGATGDVDVAALAASNNAVTFTGHLAEVKSLIAQSAVCVVPLRAGGGTRLKILESMALGTPVVSTSKGAEGLALRPDQDVLIGDTPDAFAAQVLRVLNDPFLRARLSSNGREQVVRSHTWDRMGAALDKVLDEAVADTPRAHRVASQRALHDATGA